MANTAFIQMKRIVLLLLTSAILSLPAASAFGDAEAIVAKDDPTQASLSMTSIDQFNGKKIGSATGTTYDDIVRRRLPDVTFSYYNTYSDMVAAMQSGKIAAFACDEPVLRTIMAENDQVTMMPEYLDTFEFGFIFPKNKKGSALCGQMSEFIREMRDGGELEKMEDKWLGGNMDGAEMPDIESLSGENGALTLAIDALNAPFDFMRGKQYAGYEVELALRFCERYGYGLTVRNMDFDAVLTSVQTNKADFGSATISITEERKQSVRFSEPHFFGHTVLAVLKAEEFTSSGAIDSFSDLEDKRIGVATGSAQALLAEERFPDAKLFFFSNTVDMLSALRARKIDAFADSEALVRYIMAENPDMTLLDERLGDTMRVGAVFSKTEEGQALCDAFSDYILDIRQNGIYDEILDAWFGDDDSKRVVPDLNSLPKTNGTLRVAADTTTVPFAFIKDGKPAGVDIDIVARFCKEKGYGLEIVHTDFSGIIASVVTGKVDFACGGIAYTPERAESVLYSEPTFESGSVIALLKTEKTALTEEGGSSFRDGIASSFHKTFIRENRWQLFVKGVTNTLIITLLSILCGTLLGFIVFMLCRNGNPAANLITRFCLWLVQGMPMVVLLMVLYYIIFGSVAINGIAVAVIGFTLTFGASVYGLLKMGVGAVDGGQYEAAYALGYSNRRTFFRIILPQALPHVLPAYRGEIVGLIKATAVVGYIAVQDLTKMGDIVRSRTYEAFFPLIAVTVIYFLLEGLLRLAVSRVTINLDPRRRKPGDILKGVKTDDQN